MAKKDYMVSAIVSVYNCERFIAGCLEDLERQTIVDRLEIVVVNTGSQQNEEKIIKDFQKKFNNIVYIKTKNRETVYQAWNRGIKAASGKYITNANSDDRHRQDALEIMVNELEKNKDIDLVYADDIITEVENETFENNTPAGYHNWPEFNKYEFLFACYVGAQPVWRRSLHEKYGFFDGNSKAAGDYEFWLRLSEKCSFKHIKEYLGLYLRSPSSAEHRDRVITLLETENIVNKYIKRAAQNKKFLREIKRRQWERAYELGCLYVKRKEFCSAVKAFLRCIRYKWDNPESYTGLLTCCLPAGMVEGLRKIKAHFIKKAILSCQK